jgi:hypothetical protein
MHEAVLLMIRRSWVRAPPAPPDHIEQLPSGSWRVKVYAEKDPLTGREIRFWSACKTEIAAQTELGKLLHLYRCLVAATAGKPDP